MYSHGGGWSSFSRHFFMERGESMLGDESIEIWLLVALVVLFVQVVAIYLAIKTGEKIHEKRMKEIKEKEQV
jgi:hypothetical protein